MAPDLPNEIWNTIFSNLEACKYYQLPPLCEELKRQTLRSLCLVSRRIGNLAREALYRNIAIGDGIRGPEQSLLLTQTLASNPKLGLATRAINIYDTMWVHYMYENPEPRMKQLFESLRLPCHLKDLLEADRITSGGCYSHFLPVIILALVPNVRFVQLVIPPGEHKALLWMLGGECIESQDKDKAKAGLSSRRLAANYLVNLEEVRLTERDFHLPGASAVRIVDSLLSHPNIKKLRLGKFNFTGWMIENGVFPGHQSNLRELYFGRGFVEHRYLRHILSRCRDLRILEFKHVTYCQAPYELSPEPGLLTFGDTLGDYAQNLVSLRLNGVCDYPTCAKKCTIGSLRQLKRLRHLTVHKSLLVGTGENRLPLAAALPLSLETLELRFESCRILDPEDLYEENDELFRLVSGGQFPHFRRLEYDRQPGDKFTKTIEGWTVQHENGDPNWSTKLVLNRQDYRICIKSA
ncbi:hypothetical protein F53441_8436 [Fusarium austroafricanum]|uniref:F-box domain-containing protein n=1 Tax=Fusarium austroafricanum TaxID=2364996 RepID=A0A8H4KBD3_9HYPO|nr:hypothetical protein F53441_8436 [Fusarium austroafricanum]